MTNRTRTIAVKLDDKEWDEAKKRAESRGWTISVYVRWLLRKEWLDESKAAQQA